MKKVCIYLLAVLMLCSAIACGNETPAQQDPAPVKDPAPVTEGTPAPVDAPVAPEEVDADSYINCLINSEPSTLDVAKFMAVYDRSVLQNITEPLTRIVNGVVSAAGAESWEVSEDGMTYTFTIRDNKWSDGQTVVAGDYLYAIQRQADPANAWALASDFNSIAGFNDIFANGADMSTLGVKAPDDKTLVITLTAADSGFLSNVDIFPCRKDYVEKYGDVYGTDADKIIGCGPFELTEWVHNSTLKFKKNEQYWDKDVVKLQSFTFHIMEDLNTKMAAFENGSLDYVSVSNAEYIQKFSAMDTLNSEKVGDARTFIVVFNCEDSVFSNSKIRLAFSLALDREILSQIITGGTATPAAGLIPTECSVGAFNYREETDDIIARLHGENPDLKALLVAGMEEAGLGSDPAGLTVTFSWGATTAMARMYAELIQQMWQENLGVNIELSFNESPTHMANINNGEYQCATTSWGSNPEPWFQLSRWANKKGGQSRWKNSEYTELVSSAVAVADDKTRLEMFNKAEEMLVGDAAIAPCYWTGSIRFSYGYVKNFSTNTFDTTGMKYLYTFGR